MGPGGMVPGGMVPGGMVPGGMVPGGTEPRWPDDGRATSGADPAALHRRLSEQVAWHHVVTHELTTPLTAVRELLRILEEELVGPLVAQQHDVLRAALESTETLVGYVDELFDSMSADQASARLELTAVDLGTVVQDVVAKLRQPGQHGGTDVYAVVSPNLPAVVADRLRIEHVLRNLLVQTTRAVPKGSRVCVVACAHAPRTTVAGDRPTAVLVAVHESGTTTGRGGPLDLAFDAAAARVADGALRGGIGLGASLCRELVERMGGQIVSASRPGHGGLFCFTLPVAAAGQAGSRPGSTTCRGR
ncbi:MAG: HAMP domain-containing histidine kinase [Planctomycetes bacterium]|nr:HAMP domain-containing histidine kinase [Planctomycetota bacterium]